MFAKPLLGMGTPGVVLGFHSIVTREWPSRAPMHVPTTVLASLTRVAQRLGTIVPIGDLVKRHQEGKSTRGMVAITFDDAYASLTDSEFTRRQIPFAVAAVSGYLTEGAAFWWDRVEDIYEPAPVEARRAFGRELGLATSDGGPTFDEVRREILVRYRGRVLPALDAAIGRLEEGAGRRTVQRPQTGSELRSFAARPWVTVLPHTVSHPVLPLLPDEEIASEVTGSVHGLRDIGLRVAPLLAAPYGLYDERTVRVATASGVTAVLTLAGRTLRSRRSGQIPRFCVMRGETGVKLGLRIAGIGEHIRDWRGYRERGPLEELEVSEESLS